jgi:hypothetical protein
VELAQLENRQTVLLAERQKLVSALDYKQVTLNELYSGLDRLRRENARLKVDNERQLKDKQRVEADTQKFQADISRLNTDDRLPDKAKKERIESLKSQIKTYLEVMLTQ